LGGHFYEGEEEKALIERNKFIKSDNSYKDKDEEYKKPLNKYPAYESVGIFFSKKPSEKQIEILKERANKFPSIYKKFRKYGEKIEIIGFRLIKTKIIQTEEVL
jgi:hypothetical protein